jgi:GxxExxY protein
MVATETQSTRSDAALDNLSERVIGAAIAVHRTLGPGLLESVYSRALAIELEKRSLRFTSEALLPVHYDGIPVGEFRTDLIVEEKLVVELKSVERHEPLFEAQLLTYMKLGAFPLGLLLNFNTKLLKDGIKRIIL